MLTRKTPETIATAITVIGQGENFKFNCTFRNRTDVDDKLKEFLASPEAAEALESGDFQYATRQCLLYVVKEWDAEYELTDADIKAMEDARPGIIELIFIGFHKSRRVEGAKN